MAIDVNEMFKFAAHGIPIVDVRSPGEFAQGHIPGAVNVPLFDDAERAEIGTLYKTQGRTPAVSRGLAIAGPKAAELVEQASHTAIEKELVVHCWRGGMRSESFAWLLKQCELRPHLLAGGYKAFRRSAHAAFERPLNLVTLSGMSGSGKTQLLLALRDAGEQVLDLEGLANHRGSAFGGIGLPDQPTVEQFENHLYDCWRSFDPSRPVWVESESQSIGKVYIPNPVFHQMLNSPAVVLDVDFDQRADFLVGVYGGFNASDFSMAIEKIRKRLGGDAYKKAMVAIEQENVPEIARIALRYYDRGYQRASEKWLHDDMHTVKLQKAGDCRAVEQLVLLGNEIVAAGTP